MEISTTMSGEGGLQTAAERATPAPARPASGVHPGRCSKRLLGELLALNLEMVGQLQLERVSDAGTTGFLTKMIEQHEKAAALLRTQLTSAGTGGRR